MAGNIGADFQGMHNIAVNVQKSAEEYVNSINKIYEIVQNLQSSWQGRDNVSFAEKVFSYEEDLKNLGKALENYALFLNEAARTLNTTQDEIASSAGRL